MIAYVGVIITERYGWGVWGHRLVMSRIKNSQRQGKQLVDLSSTNAFRLIRNYFKNDLVSVQNYA